MNSFATKIMANRAVIYKPATLPEDIERGKLGDCFDHCLLQAAKNEKYTYVEGYVFSPLRQEWIYHAWLTDGEHAFDPTWRATNAAGEDVVLFMMKYIGVPMDTKKTARFVSGTGYKAVFKNYWRDPHLANKIFV